MTGVAEIPDVLKVIEGRLDEDRATLGTTLLRADTAVGRVVIGDGIAPIELGALHLNWVPDVPCAPPLELYVLPDGGRLYRENLWS